MGKGYNGHALRCECAPCVQSRVSAYLDRVADTSRLVPETRDQTVAVRAHWRRGHNHLNKQPKYRAALAAGLAALRKQGSGK